MRKTVAVWAKDRATNQVRANVLTSAGKGTLQGFVKNNAAKDATVYATHPFAHEDVNHSVSEYVRAEAHTNGMESF